MTATVFCGAIAVAGATMGVSAAVANTFVKLQPAGSPPAIREEATGVYDQSSSRFIMFGGMGPVCCDKRSDVWILTNPDGFKPEKGQWVELPIPGFKLERTNHSAAYSPQTNRMIVYGGETNDRGVLYDEVWILTNANGLNGPSQWQQLSIPGSSLDHPVPRGGQSAVYDKQKNRLIVFGGFYEFRDGAVLNDVWVLTNADGRYGKTSRWLKLNPTGAAPLPRTWAFATYEQISNRMLVFGGNDFVGTGMSFNDVWILNNANGLGGPPSWVKQTPMVMPPARFSPAGGLSQGGDLVIFGGTDNTMAYKDTWLLRSAFGPSPKWTKSIPSGEEGPTSPPNLSQTANAYVPVRDTLIFSTGDRDPICCSYINDTFVLRSATKR